MLARTFCPWFLAVAGILLCTSCSRPTTTATYNARIGVAVPLSDRICLAIRNSKLLPSATITLIAPADASRNLPVTTARAQVLSGAAAACPGTGTDADISSYNLQITTGSVEPNVPLIALDARVPSVLAAHSFRSCYGSNGVQLTAWDGAKPLEGHRLWHQSYEMGQRAEVNCTAAETAAY